MGYHFLVFFLLVFFLLLWSKIFIDALKKTDIPYIKIVVCIICVCLFKCDWGIHFWGLEYEDAYSFSAYARQLSFGITSDSLRLQCVDIGSLLDPQSLGTYGGHYITYPIFLYLFTSIFGFSITSISLVNSVISLLSLLTIAFYKYPNKYGWFIGVLLFCLAPAVNLFSTCFLSESFSSFLCLCFVLSYFDRNNHNSILFRIFILVSFLLCILTKRDNTVILIVPAIYSLYALWNKNYKLALNEIIPFVIILILSTLFIHNFLIAEVEESSDISQSTFSFDIFCSQLPIYLKSLFSFTYFNICMALFLFVIVLNIILRRFDIRLTCLVALFFVSLLMYSSHYRGYYFVENLEPLSEFVTFRYINNFFYAIPLFIALSFRLHQKYIMPIIVTLSILSLGSILLTYNLRITNNNEEYNLRFRDIEIIDEIVTNNDVVITDVPLLFLNVSTPDRYICNIQRISDINFNAPHKFYFYVDDWLIVDKRYNLGLSKYNKRLIKTLPSDKKLYLIE